MALHRRTVYHPALQNLPIHQETLHDFAANGVSTSGKDAGANCGVPTDNSGHDETG